MRKLVPLLLFLAAAGAALAHAQGGPPFITDDPAPPGNHHWEINFGWIADHSPGQSYYEIPDVDMNYGWGNRIQLKWEQPLAAGTNANDSTGVGLGESLLGIKFRAYQHYIAGKEKTDDNINFSIGTYPQVSLNTPAGSAQRGIVEPGPQYYLPMEVTAQVGWLALDGEVGRWIGNANMPNQWGRGLIAGHAFSDRFEAYTEIYDLQAINRIGDQPKQRELTLDLGGRQSLDRANHIRLLFSGGRAIQAVTPANGEPSWIAYVGVQFLLGPKTKMPHRPTSQWENRPMPSDPILLTAAQARVLGALVEKEVTTPDYYPLSLNALINACNQRSNREPVMNLDEDDARQALHGLEDKRLAGRARSADGRVTKYEHWLGEAFNFSRAETALLCVLLLRGPQTPGELRGRTERLHSFDEIADVLAGIQKLMDREPPLAAILPRQPGAKEARYAHLFSGPVESIQLASFPIASAETGSGRNSSSAGSAGPDLERLERLETSVDELRQQVAALNQKIDNLFG